MSAPLPPAKEVRDLLEAMIGRNVEVATGAGAVDPGAGPGAVVGVYTEGSLALSTIIVLDLATAAYAGAAIALVPPGAAEAAIESEVLPDSLLENAAEILNVMRSLFNVEGAPHHQLYATYAPGETLPSDVAKWSIAYVPRVDLTVDIQGYGTGRLSVIVVPG